MHVFRISIGNRMNTSDHKSRNARAGSYDFLFIIFSTKLLLSSFSCSYSSIFGFTFHWVAHVCQTFDQVCVAFNVFLFFAFSLRFLNDVLVWQSKLVVSHFFIIWCSNLALPQCFHGNFSVLHSITSIALYNLFMHSSLTNQKCDILLSI